MPDCAKCGAHYDERFDGCPLCANAVAGGGSPRNVYLPDISTPFGYGGALLLVVGTLLPALKLSAIVFNAEFSLLGGGPGFEAIRASANSPIQNFQILGVVLVAFAIGTVALMLIKMRFGLWATGALALAVTAYGYLTLNSKIAELIVSTGADPRALSGMIQPGSGWIALTAGSLLILASAFTSMLNGR